MEVVFYQTSSGACPVEKYLKGIPKVDREDIVASFRFLEEQGPEHPLVDTRHIDGRLWEIKCSKHRIFYVVILRSRVILLHAYKKQGQKAPQNEIVVARKRMKESISIWEEK